MKTVWIVDDDQAIRWVLEKALSRAGIQTRSFAGATEVMEAMESELPAALISDIRMPGTDGLKLLKRTKEQHPGLPVIIMTAYSDLDSTVSAFQGGAFDYLAKPFDVNDAVALIQRAIQDPQLDEVDLATGQGGAAASSEKGMLTQSSSTAMQEVFRAIGKLAQSNVTVLITGESGTGKELVARALHQHGMRSQGPFVALNTAAIPRDLLEAELFGHERGAFTGANALRRGRFEEANVGTLFLDEIGEIGMRMQIDLLRVLEDRVFYRLGGTQPLEIDFRVIAATNRDLQKAIKAGSFREDLYYRLNVVSFTMPALRERKEDLPLLVEHFLNRFAQETNKPIERISRAAMDEIMIYDWPGNVRELENAIERAVVVCKGSKIMPEDLPIFCAAESVRPDTNSLVEIEKTHITQVLNANDWNISRSAKILEIDRSTLYNKIKRYKIQKPS